jgi:phosphoglycolate phosphatase
MRTSNHVIFDLDGTLVDSCGGVLYSLQYAADYYNLKPSVPLGKEIIGPPLDDLLVKVFPYEYPNILSDVGALFKRHYDLHGCLLSKPYPHIPEILKKLHMTNTPMSLVTNKREAPTLKIIEELHWQKYFEAIICSDSGSSRSNDKSSNLRYLHQSLGINPNLSVYIGDTYEDYVASSRSKTKFIFASWGYGNTKSTLLPDFIHKPSNGEKLLSILLNS